MSIKQRGEEILSIMTKRAEIILGENPCKYTVAKEVSGLGETDVKGETYTVKLTKTF